MKFLALFGGPIVWLLQLNAGFALASQPCFLEGERLTQPTPGGAWTWGAMLGFSSVAFFLALLCAFTSYRSYTGPKESRGLQGQSAIAGDDGRAEFLSLWGICLGFGAALAIILTSMAFFTLPRCAG